jgi:hypothetical protein
MGKSSVLLIDLQRLISARQWWISSSKYACDDGYAGDGGAASSEMQKMVYRADEPKQFWRLVALHYLSGVFLIGYFLCSMSFVRAWEI